MIFFGLDRSDARLRQAGHQTSAAQMSCVTVLLQQNTNDNDDNGKASGSCRGSDRSIEAQCDACSFFAGEGYWQMVSWACRWDDQPACTGRISVFLPDQLMLSQVGLHFPDVAFDLLVSSFARGLLWASAQSTTLWQSFPLRPRCATEHCGRT